MRLAPRLIVPLTLATSLAFAALAHAAPIPLERVPDPSRAVRFDGSPGSPVAHAPAWRQLLFELRAAAPAPGALPDLDALAARARAVRAGGALPIALLDLGVADAAGGASRAFAATALVERTWRGGDVAFVLAPDLFVSDGAAPPARLEADPGDGGGFRDLALGAPLRAHYASTGPATVTVRLTDAAGAVRVARFGVDVAALTVPTPDDTLHVTGTVPFRGGVASGDAYVYLAPGHTRLVNPIVMPEGFDIDNTMNWDELYALLDQQGLADTLHTLGYDEVVLNFADATDYIERNAFVLVELMNQVQAAIDPSATVAVVGPSMGGLVARYALGWMETNGVPHRARTFVSFDAPHAGADIPLGIQYWMGFFSGQSASAAYLLGRLDTPGSREMLVYHHTTPASSSPGPDSLRAVLLADLAAVGDWPAQPRKVAIANGSGTAAGQGFAAGAQVIQYDYNVFVAHITGNVWAVPDNVSTKIFDGRIQVIFQTTVTQAVTVSGTKPYDSAPGGWRATMTQMDTTAVPYGDIVALYPHHAFIPTISALDVAGAGLYDDLSADPALLAKTPFDAVHFPTANQEHVTITPENEAWLLDEIQRGVLAVGPAASPRILALAAPAPDPLVTATTLRFTLPSAGRARLAVHALDGRKVATLVDGPLAAGSHTTRWDARDGAGNAVAPGVYFARLEAAGETRVRRMVVVR